MVLVTLDTTRVDHLGPYGSTRDVTPNLDALARESVTFTRAWSSSPWTLPAHASLFTGLQPARHGAHADASSSLTLARAMRRPTPFADTVPVGKLDARFDTLAELLAAAGLRTGAFVGGPWLERPFGLLQGFEVADDDVGDVIGRPADVVTDRAIAWLAGLAADERFFLFVNYFDPHFPYRPPAGFDDLPHAREPFELEPIVSDLLRGTRQLDAAELAIVTDRYDGEIRFMDQQLGRLLEAVRAHPAGRRALVIVTADHGEALGDGGRWFHTYWLSQELLHVPLLVRFPDGRGAGTRNDSLVQGVDLLPLVASELGLAPPPDLDGLAPGAREVARAQVWRQELAIRVSPARFDRDLEALVAWPFKLVRSSRGEIDLARVDGPHEEPRRDARAETRLLELLGPAPASGPAPALVRPEVDADTRERLRQLGYTE